MLPRYYPFLLLALFFAFCGMFAQTLSPYSTIAKDIPKNYFFYKYLAQLHPIELQENIQKDYNISSENPQLELDLCNQIVVLARVAQRKFYFFNRALQFVVASLFTPVGALIFYFWNRKEA